MPDINGLIRRHVAETILFRNSYEYSDDASFLEEGIVDSMNLLQLISFVEERFGVNIEDREITPDNFDSVSRLAAFIRSKSPAFN